MLVIYIFAIIFFSRRDISSVFVSLHLLSLISRSCTVPKKDSAKTTKEPAIRCKPISAVCMEADFLQVILLCLRRNILSALK